MPKGDTQGNLKQSRSFSRSVRNVCDPLAGVVLGLQRQTGIPDPRGPVSHSAGPNVAAGAAGHGEGTKATFLTNTRGSGQPAEPPQPLPQLPDSSVTAFTTQLVRNSEDVFAHLPQLGSCLITLLANAITENHALVTLVT